MAKAIDLLARYHGRPFESGTGIRKPGWYAWEPGKFAATLREVPWHGGPGVTGEAVLPDGQRAVIVAPLQL